MVAYYERKMSPSQAVRLMRKLLPGLRAQGRKHMAAAARREPPAGASSHNTRQVIAAQCGWSWHTLQKALRVVEAAEADPGRYAGLVQNMDTIWSVDRAFTQLLDKECGLVRRNPEVFQTKLITGKALGELSSLELRWLVGFFSALGESALLPRAEAVSAVEIFSACEVRRAIARGNAFKRAGYSPELALVKGSGKCLPSVKPHTEPVRRARKETR